MSRPLQGLRIILDLARGRGVSVDGGNVYVTGYASGDLNGGASGSPGSCAFLAKYAIPEPATLTMLALGVLAMLRRRRVPGAP